MYSDLKLIDLLANFIQTFTIKMRSTIENYLIYTALFVVYTEYLMEILAETWEEFVAKV